MSIVWWRGLRSPLYFVLYFLFIGLFWAFLQKHLLPWYEISEIILTFAADIGQVASGGAAASEKMSE